MRTRLCIICLVILPVSGLAQSTQYTIYPDIPRIDVHTHVYNDYKSIVNYLEMRDLLISGHKIDLAMWISLGGESSIDSINEVSKGRIMTCISDYAPHRGLTHKPTDIAPSLKRGYVGYKIWHGPSYRRLDAGEEGIKYVDDPAHESVLAAMEREGMVAASMHISDPFGPFGNRGKWAVNTVEYWRQIIGLERVLQRHPKLIIVTAHCSWLICQDAQIDFLRYLLSTYPNLYVDLAATFQFFHLVDYDNLRDFIIGYSDRILYGTDISRIEDSSRIPNYVQRYFKTFQILETDMEVEGGFFGSNTIKGLNLPREVLEKIYYRNTINIYSGIRERMRILGYKI